ncbi:hypothetical protein [Terriglobus tenax]|uniref:hypothetical protein n=1 Tax=Terriglobus tenax TaxID=1111115 RepID=UPI0021E0D258|nr:hypothetical protein [Terriglobus tenax]
MKTSLRFAILLPVSALLLSGCRVSSTGESGNKDVRVATPFGGMQVKTDPEKVVSGLGLPVYPGAILDQKHKDGKDEPDAADLNMGFGDFRIHIKAVTYTTPDSADKVEAYYRKALAEYGDVIACKDDKPVGTPTRTGQGLTCDEKDGHVNVNGKGTDTVKGDLNLRAGSKQHQHIVGIEKKDGVTRFGLVALDLPGKLSFDSDDDDKGKKEREAN